jgi:hypothetical protein
MVAKKNFTTILLIAGVFVSCGGNQGEGVVKEHEDKDVVIEMISEPESVEDWERVIRADKDWMERMKEKASKREISLDEAIVLDAQWVVSEKAKNAPKTVASVVQAIKNDDDWLSAVEKKAKERSISVDDMIIMEAEYVVAQAEKKKKIE